MSLTLWCALWFVAGACTVQLLWSNEKHFDALVKNHMNDAHRHSQAIARCVVILLFVVLASLFNALRAQATQPYDGQMYHQLPPPMNIVNAGYLLERSANTRRDATYSLLAGTATYLLLQEQNRTVAGVGGGIGVGISVTLNLASCRFQRTASHLMLLGYGVNTRYDIVPDSVDAGRHMRIQRR